MSSATLDGRMLIGGQRVEAASGEWFETLDPANGRPLARIARGDGRDVDAAVKDAREAFDRVWSRTAPLKRVQLLNRVAALIRERSAELAALESTDVGKPLRQAEADAEAAAQFFEYYAGAADKVFGTSIPLGPSMLDYTVPLGIRADEWLTVAARRHDDRPLIAPADSDARSVVIRIKGGDLAAFRAGQLTKDEALKRMEVRVF